MMDIDLVYLWVDGADPAWRARKAQYTSEAGVSAAASEDAAGACRYCDNDELRYSLRSVERYAPWIRYIHIVTDDQCPAWLDTSNPRIRIVPHRMLFDADTYPLFNSNAIETHLTRIPDLSEHFLYGNDDTMFAQSVTPSFFFDSTNRPIVRMRRGTRDTGCVYYRTIKRMQRIVQERYGKFYDLEPHHNIDAYTRRAFDASLKWLADIVAETRHHRLRQDDDWQRVAVSYHMLATGEGSLKIMHRTDSIRSIIMRVVALATHHYRCDSHVIPLYCPDFAAKMRRFNPTLVCMNDSEEVTFADRRRARQFLEQLFPQKSSFEL